jgi:hypothetical protein
MESEKVAGILGAIVAIAVLVIAFVYVPVGQLGKTQPAVQKVDQSKPAAPAVRGPVVRDVPQ